METQGLPFNVVKLEQRTEAWYRWRHEGIGASDAPKIMGENPFESSAELLTEKLGPAGDRASNAAMDRGEECEAEALEEYFNETGHDLVPLCIESKEYPWMHASLDSISRNFAVAVEIKCGASAYRKAAQYGVIPDYYHGQLQHILAVSGLPSIDYWCWQPGCRGILIPVRRNDGYIARLIKAESTFWKRIQKGR